MLKRYSLLLLLLFCAVALAAPPAQKNADKKSRKRKFNFDLNNKPTIGEILEHQRLISASAVPSSLTPQFAAFTSFSISYASAVASTLKPPTLAIASTSEPPTPAVASTSEPQIPSLVDMRSIFGPNKDINLSPEQVKIKESIQRELSELEPFRYYNDAKEMDKILEEVLSKKLPHVNDLRAKLLEARNSVNVPPKNVDIALALPLSKLLKTLPLEAIQQAIGDARARLHEANETAGHPGLEFSSDDNDMDDRIRFQLSKLPSIALQRADIAIADAEVYIGIEMSRRTVEELRYYNIYQRTLTVILPEFQDAYKIYQALKTARREVRFEEIEFEKKEPGKYFNVDLQLTIALARQPSMQSFWTPLSFSDIDKVIKQVRLDLAVDRAIITNRLGALSHILYLGSPQRNALIEDALKNAVGNNLNAVLSVLLQYGVGSLSGIQTALEMAVARSNVNALEALMNHERTTRAMVLRANRKAVAANNHTVITVIDLWKRRDFKKRQELKKPSIN